MRFRIVYKPKPPFPEEAQEDIVWIGEDKFWYYGLGAWQMHAWPYMRQWAQRWLVNHADKGYKFYNELAELILNPTLYSLRALAEELEDDF